MAYRNRSGSPGHETLAGTVRLLAAEALVFPTGLVTAAYLTRRLGADGYGVFSLAALIITWVQWSAVSLLSRSTILSVRQAVDWKPLGTRILQIHLAAEEHAVAARRPGLHFQLAPAAQRDHPELPAAAMDPSRDIA